MGNRELSDNGHTFMAMRLVIMIIEFCMSEDIVPPPPSSKCYLAVLDLKNGSAFFA